MKPTKVGTLNEELIAIAKVAKPRGIKGEVAADLLTDFPERFELLETVTAVMPDGTKRELTIEDSWLHGGRIVLKFAGFDSMNDAEALRDVKICIAESEAVELEDGEYYDWQLAGCRVETPDGRTVGVLRELMRTAAGELLVVDGEEKEFLIPFVEAICTDVDVIAKKIVIDPPDGLLEF